jgi:hypothetical protein
MKSGTRLMGSALILGSYAWPWHFLAGLFMISVPDIINNFFVFILHLIH